MKKIINIFLITLLLISCKEKKTEFIQSNIYKNIFLLKNPPKGDSLTKIQLIEFLLKNPVAEMADAEFYIYTKNWDPLHKGTSYFLDHEEDPGGFSSEELSNYRENKLAAYIISECENDSTKLVGELFFYGLRGAVSGMREIDTLIYNCE